MPENKSYKEAGGAFPKDIRSLEVLSMGIYNEESAYDFYISVSKKIKNQSGKEKFEALASDEKRHRQILENLYRKESGKDFDFNPSKVKKIEFEIEDQTGAFEAIDIAMEAERQAYLFYTRASEKAENKEAKRMFQTLAEEEDGHYQKLSAERNALSGGFYWFDIEDSGFVEH